MIFVAEHAENFVDQIQEPTDLDAHLLRSAEHVRVVLGESAHTQHAVQYAAPFIAIAGAELRVPDGKVTIRASFGLINRYVTRAIHRLWAIRRALDLHRPEHVLSE